MKPNTEEENPLAMSVESKKKEKKSKKAKKKKGNPPSTKKTNFQASKNPFLVRRFQPSQSPNPNLCRKNQGRQVSEPLRQAIGERIREKEKEEAEKGP